MQPNQLANVLHWICPPQPGPWDCPLWESLCLMQVFSTKRSGAGMGGKDPDPQFSQPFTREALAKQETLAIIQQPGASPTEVLLKLLQKDTQDFSIRSMSKTRMSYSGIML